MRYLISILLSIGILHTFAQTNGGSETIDSVDIITIYQPDVAESVKKEILPKLEEPKSDPVDYNYSFPDLSYQPKAVYSPIDPIYLKEEKLEDLDDNYIEIGGGNYLTSYVDARIHNTQDKYYTYGLMLKHHASSFSKNPNQGLFSENRIKAFGMREKGGTFKADIDYRRNVVHYYGYEEAFDYSLNDINQIYNDVSADILWENDNSRMENSLDLNFNLFDRLSGNENTVALVNKNNFKSRQADIHFDLGASYNTINREVSYNRLILDILPHVEFSHKKYDFDLGINVNYLNDSNTSQLYYAPYLKAQTYLVPKKLRAYAGIIGGLEKNTMREMTYNNLFLGKDAEFRNPYEKLHIYAGMNGSFKRFVEYGIRMSQRFVNDQYFFVNDTNSYRNLTTVYDSFSVFTFSGELKLDINSNLDIGFAGQVYAYNMTNQDDAWYLPSYDAKAFVTVRLAEKIYISGAYYAISPRTALNLRGESTKLIAINDINAGLEYRYKKNISAFLNIQNLLNQRYQLYDHYNAQGFNLLLGVTFSI